MDDVVSPNTVVQDFDGVFGVARWGGVLHNPLAYVLRNIAHAAPFNVGTAQKRTSNSLTSPFSFPLVCLVHQAASQLQAYSEELVGWN